MKNSNIFVILVGPSGVGKSTLIREIIAQSTDFEYVKPYMTRPLREGETEKISISAEEFSKMEQNGDFLVVNEHYGYKYGTPKTTILKIQSERRVPILDYQLSTIQNLYNPAYTLLNIYIRPQTIQEWEDRLEASEQFDESRLILGKAELERVLNNEKINSIDHIVINRNSELTQTAAEIRKIITNHLENSETNSNKLTLESYETGYNEYIQNAPSNRGGAIEQWIDKSLDGLSTEASILEIGSAYGRDARIIEEKGSL